VNTGFFALLFERLKDFAAGAMHSVTVVRIATQVFATIGHHLVDIDLSTANAPSKRAFLVADNATVMVSIDPLAPVDVAEVFWWWLGDGAFTAVLVHCVTVTDQVVAVLALGHILSVFCAEVVLLAIAITTDTGHLASETFGHNDEGVGASVEGHAKVAVRVVELHESAREVDTEAAEVISGRLDVPLVAMTHVNSTVLAQSDMSSTNMDINELGVGDQFVVTAMLILHFDIEVALVLAIFHLGQSVATFAEEVNQLVVVRAIMWITHGTALALTLPATAIHSQEAPTTMEAALATCQILVHFTAFPITTGIAFYGTTFQWGAGFSEGTVNCQSNQEYCQWPY
jgi:NADH:ubiquinone oxidoreductase subunit 3 (subunit A)